MDTTARPRLTVGELRAALHGRPDDELVTVYVDDWYHNITDVEVPSDDDGIVTVVLTVGEPFDTRFDL